VIFARRGLLALAISRGLLMAPLRCRSVESAMSGLPVTHLVLELLGWEGCAAPSMKTALSAKHAKFEKNRAQNQ
jgi:hypothetical protein